MGVDKIDIKILAELDRNSRVTYSKLSKMVGLKQETIRYRVNSLVDRGLIQQFFTIVDLPRLGYSMHKILLKLKNVNERKLKKIIDSLINNKRVVWLATLEGNWDLGIIIRVKNVLDYELFVDDLFESLNQQILRKKFSVNLHGLYFPRNSGTQAKKSPMKYEYSSSPEKIYHIDEDDKIVLKHLCESSRVSSSKIARELRVSIDTVIQKRKNLEEKGIIAGYSLINNCEILDMVRYKIFIYLSDFDKEKVKGFINYLSAIHQVVYIIKSLGEWNYEVGMMVDDSNVFRKIVMEIMNKYSDIVYDYNSTIVTNIYKYKFFSM